MAGPCPSGHGTQQAHMDAKCRDRERCTGPGCRVRRAPYVDRHLEDMRRQSVAAAAARMAGVVR